MKPRKQKLSSLKHAANALKAEGIESATVSTVKALAAEFPESVDSHGRVTITEKMIAWVRERVNSAPIPDKETLQCCKLIVEVKRILFNAEKEQDLYIAKADFDAWVAETRAQVEIILKKKLKNELPPKLEGLRAAEMAAKMDEVIAPLVKLMRFCRTSATEVDE